MEYVDSGKRGAYSHIVMGTMASNGAPLTWCNVYPPGWPFVDIMQTPSKPVCPACQRRKDEYGRS